MFHSSRYSNPICLLPVQILGQRRTGVQSGAGGARTDQGAAPPLRGSGLSNLLGQKEALLEGRPRMEKERTHNVRL